MSILKKFLANRLNLGDWRQLDLLVNTQEQENAVIPNDLTLGLLQEIRLGDWKKTRLVWGNKLS